MGAWGLIQIVVDIFFGVGIFIIAMRLNRPAKDDPRLSRGLQLLQSKIAVLEDLSDRTEVQVNQLTALLDQKTRELQNKIQQADRQVQVIKGSMDKSLEVAKIFQDKIPHHEIIERQNTIKYVQAARLAHKGVSVEEIAKVVDLPPGEIEFIAKVNREQLMFSEEQLPPWAKSELEFVESEENVAAGYPSTAGYAGAAAMGPAAQTGSIQAVSARAPIAAAIAQDYSKAFEVPQVSMSSLEKLGEEFRKACAMVNAGPDVYQSPLPQSIPSPLIHEPTPVARESIPSANPTANAVASTIVPGRGSQEATALTPSAPAIQPSQTAQAPQAAQTPRLNQTSQGAHGAQPARSAQTVELAQSGQTEQAEPVIRIANASAAQASSSKTPPVIRKVQFPKINPNDNLS